MVPAGRSDRRLTGHDNSSYRYCKFRSGSHNDKNKHAQHSVALIGYPDHIPDHIILVSDKVIENDAFDRQFTTCTNTEKNNEKKKKPHTIAPRVGPCVRCWRRLRTRYLYAVCILLVVDRQVRSTMSWSSRSRSRSMAFFPSR